MKIYLSLLFTAGIVFFFSCTKTGTSELPLSPVFTIVTTPVTEIQNDSAVSGFTITNTDTLTIVERGIVWNTVSMPTTNFVTKLSTNADSASLTFHFGGLNCGTRYFVRAYAVTYSQGTVYGNQEEFNTSTNPPSYVNQLDLSKTQLTDTTVWTEYINQFYPSNGFHIKTELTLPQGVNMYVKFDSVIHSVKCYDGTSMRLVNAGDTMHFRQLDSTISGFPGFGTDVYAVQYTDGMGLVYNDSWAKVSIHIGGVANTNETTYACKYSIQRLHTNTYVWLRFLYDNSPCSTPCTFQ